MAKTKKDFFPQLLTYMLLGSIALAVISHYFKLELTSETYTEFKNLFFIPLKAWIFPVIAIAMFGIFFRSPSGKASKFFILFLDIIALYLLSTLIASAYAFFSFPLFPFAETIAPLMSDAKETFFTKKAAGGIPTVILVIIVGMAFSLVCRYILLKPFAKFSALACAIFTKIFSPRFFDLLPFVKSLKDDYREATTTNRDLGYSLALINLVERFIFMVLALILLLAPIAVFASFLEILNAHGIKFFYDLGKFIASYATILLSYQFLILPLVRSIFCLGIKGEDYWSFLKKSLPVIVTAGATASSAATLATNIQAAQSLDVPADMKNKGHNRAIMPIGATFNMDGTSISLVVYFLLAANFAGVDVGFWPVVLTAVILSVGTAAVPSASLVMLTSMYSTFSIPAAITSKLLSIIIAIDPLHDRLRTIVNTWGDLNMMYIVQHKRGFLSILFRKK